jgi:hypothetical protein
MVAAAATADRDNPYSSHAETTPGSTLIEF